MRGLLAAIALLASLTGAASAQGIGFSAPISTPLSLPASPAGFWVGADLTSANGPATVPNRLATTTSNQIIAAPRRQFCNTYYFTIGSATCVDNAAVAPDGTRDATTLITAASAGWYAQVGNSGGPVSNVLPSGTYTAAVSIRWRGTTGGTQFAHGCAVNLAGMTLDTAADTAWHRYTMTFTSNGSTALFCYAIGAPAGGTIANFEVVDFNIYKGSSDLGGLNVPLVGHMVFSGSALAPAVTHDATSWSHNGALGAAVQFPEAVSYNAHTICYISKNTGNPTNATFNPVISRLNPSTWVSYGVGVGLNGPWGLQWNNALKTVVQGLGYNIENRANYQDVCISYDPLGTGVATVYVNGTLVIANTASGISQNIQEFWVGMLQRTFFSDYQIAAMALWPRVLTDAEVMQEHNYMLQNVIVAMPDADWGIAEGDSITFGASITNNAGWATYTFQGLKRVVHGPDLAVPGQTCSTIQSRIGVDTTNIALAVAAGRKVWWHVLCGTNDSISGTNPTTVTAPTIEAMATSAKTAGANALIATMLPAAGTCGGCLTFRATLNPLLRTWAGSNGVTIDDFAADPTMGPDGAQANAALYNADQIHPTGPPTTNTTGAFFLYGDAVAAINGVM